MSFLLTFISSLLFPFHSFYTYTVSIRRKDKAYAVSCQGFLADGGSLMVTERRRPLDRRTILEAAVRFVDSEGLEALSMRKLGAELGVEAMSLYNHVPNKGALLDGMVEVLLGEL